MQRRGRRPLQQEVQGQNWNNRHWERVHYEDLDKEKTLDVKKRDGTFVLNNMEISYPFIQPWEYLLITL